MTRESTEEKAFEAFLNGEQSFAYDDYDDEVCEGYPEHDYELFDERDGIKVYHCRRCGAESDEEVAT